MATEPPVSTRNLSFSESFSMSDFESHHASTKRLSSSFSVDGGGRRVLEHVPIQFSTMTNEIQRVRSRFTSEKSNSDQFSSQLRMLSQQIESLTGQQSSMLEFHIKRMDTMLKELNASEDVAKQQRTAFEAAQRAKFEREQRERIAHEERERIEREERGRIEREDHQRREVMENLERERCERGERERIEREQREQEHRERMQCLQRTPLQSMNLSDIIPEPSRTVTASKRKLSLDFGSSQRIQQGDNKRAKVDALKQTEKEIADSAIEFTSTNLGEAVPMEDPEPPVDGPDPAEMDLPTDIQDALKQRAMAMLQAQLNMGETPPEPQLDTVLLPLDAGMPPLSAQLTAVVKSEPHIEPPQLSAPTAMESAASITKPETPSAALAPLPDLKDVAQRSCDSGGSASASLPPLPHVKPETPSKPKLQFEKKSAKKPARGSSKKAKKDVTPAVEDTTITDPMRVPLKNKAIHAWMAKDPERLYSANDICKAGIRYRVLSSMPSRGLLKEVRNVLGIKRNNNRLWKFVKLENGDQRWQVILRSC